MKISNEVTEKFVQYAEAHNKQEETDQLFDSFVEQLESEYDFETSDKILEILCTCNAKTKEGFDLIMAKLNLLHLASI
jgi:isocitrate/isopropylmalate dehydrogenase